MTAQRIPEKSAIAFATRDKPNAVNKGYLSGKILLYVGGRTSQVPHLRKLAEAQGADLLHHDGGLAESARSLAILTSRADAVLFPVDCVSHSAAKIVKRICRQSGKSYFPLRRSGPGSFAQFIEQLR